MKQSGHGGDIYTATHKLARSEEDILDFSANINPFGLPIGIKKALIEAVDHVEHYPDPYCRKLQQSIAEMHALPVDYILCGNGAADLIFRLAYTLRPKKGLVCAPTFSEYAAALKSVGAEIMHYVLNEEEGFRLTEDFLEALDESIDLIYLCNPNNPTGIPINKELTLKILEKCQLLNIICMIDECFCDFLENEEDFSLVKELDHYSNLIILKAFTKMYAIPGVRLGYALSSRVKLLEDMYHIGQCWGVSTLAQAAGCAASKEKQFVSKTVEYVANERNWMIKVLRNMGYIVYESQVNYIFFHSLNIPLHEELYKQGILIRNCDNYISLKKGYLRIAIKEHTQNKQLIQSIERITNQWQNQ